MNRIAISIATLALALAATTQAAAPPRIFQSDGAVLADVKQRIAAGDPALTAAVKRLSTEADKALRAGPYAVTDKKHPQPGGDPHDYVSLAPYFWPNPDTADGLPYVRHDGRRNPETKDYDAERFGAMSGHSHTLALAWYLTGNEAYARRAAELLRAWFITAATRMNPNLTHAQLVKGKNQGRGTGIIESVRLLDVVDAVGLLHGSTNWTADDDRPMRDWFSQYIDWLRKSKNGRDEAAAGNNHGTWYDVQLVSFLLFVGDEAEARKIVEAAKAKRIARQIKPDGSLPLELARTKSFSYTVFDLKAFTQLADLASRLGVDLWNYHTADGRGLRAAVDSLLPYARGEKQWTREQIVPLDLHSLYEPLYRAAAAYHDAKLAEVARQVGARDLAAAEMLCFPTASQ